VHPVKTEKSGLEHDVYIVVIRQTSLARFDPAIISDLLVQPLHSLCQKSLDPLVDKAAADANRLRNISDRHPLGKE
jgi:hypothetical protein